MAVEAFGEVGDGGRRAWNRARWQAHVRAQAESGEPVSAYCRAHGLRPQSFYRWPRIFGDEEAIRSRVPTRTTPPDDARQGRSAALFAEVDLAACGLAAPSGVEVCLQTGHVVRIARDFDAPTLQRVVAALEDVAC